MYKFADFTIDMNSRYQRVEESCKNYFLEREKCDVAFSCTDAEIEFENQENRNFSNGYLEFIALFRKLAEWLPLHNAFVLHSATFDINGVGVAFAAHSGTGKTTHMRLWQEYLGDKMVVVNGDKPIVRFFEDEPESPYAYGTPWNGKERLGCNMRTPLKHICFIERSEKNYVEPMDKSQAIDRIFNQVYMPKDPMAVMNTMQLIDRLLSCCKLWTIHCNMEPDAAHVAYKTIFGE